MKNQPNATQLKDAVSVLVSLVRNAHLKRVLHSVDPEPHLNFWRVIYGNLLDLAVLEWCKLFGSDNAGHQPTHWKNLVPASDHGTFRQDLLQHLKIDIDEWMSYREKMKTYRDTCVAHDDVRKRVDVTVYPDLNIAMESSYFYYSYLLKELRRRGIGDYPTDLRTYCATFAEQATLIAREAMAATAEIKEKVR
ncbi:MAG: hypothetical protein M0Z28_05445 [Rhodospirillales bacterium]|nr:hypothetical protein [Rhodospirillales bacterium]